MKWIKIQDNNSDKKYLRSDKKYLRHLRKRGVLAEVERLMAEDAAGIKRPTISAEEFLKLLEESIQD